MLISACIVGGLCCVLLLKSWVHCNHPALTGGVGGGGVGGANMDTTSLRDEDSRYYKCFAVLLMLSSVLQS